MAGQVVVHHAALKLALPAQNLHRLLVELVQGLEVIGDEVQPSDFRQRLAGQVGDEPSGHPFVGRGFNHQTNLGGGHVHLHRHLRGLVLRAVNDVSPVDQLRQRLRVEAEALAGHRGQELGAGLVGGVVEFLLAGVAPEVFLILRRQESALVVVEPPSQPG